MTVVQHCEDTKCHSIFHSKKANSVLCKFYLKKLCLKIQMLINIYLFMQMSLRIEVMADRFGDVKLIFKSKLVSFSTGD